MGIQANYTSDNGISGNYFNILRGDIVVAPGTTTPRIECLVGFYASEEARRTNANPMRQFLVSVPLTDLTEDVRTALYPALKERMKTQIPGFADGVVTDVLEDTPFTSLDELKARKKSEINSARLAANLDSFTFLGKEIACDALSRSDIDGMNGYVTLFGEFPENWVGQWKTQDNNYVPIETIEDWKSFYSAMVTEGQSNFMYAQALKTLLDSATAPNQVETIRWGVDLTTFQLPQPIEVTA